jgi:hypothetical protein
MPKVVFSREYTVESLRDESYEKILFKSVHNSRSEIMLRRVDEELIHELIQALEAVPYVSIDWDVLPDFQLAQELGSFSEFLHYFPRGWRNCDFTGDSRYVKSVSRLCGALRSFSQQNVRLYAALYAKNCTKGFGVKGSLGEELRLNLPCAKKEISVVFSHECERFLRLNLSDDGSLVETFSLAFLWNRQHGIQRNLIDRLARFPEYMLSSVVGSKPIHLEEFAKFSAVASEMSDKELHRCLPGLVPDFLKEAIES